MKSKTLSLGKGDISVTHVLVQSIYGTDCLGGAINLAETEFSQWESSVTS